MKQELIGGTIGTAMGIVGTAMQTQEVLQIISLIATIIGAIITYIVMPLLLWHKRAKQDGKIDTDELKEGAKIIADVTQKINDEINKKEGK